VSAAERGVVKAAMRYWRHIIVRQSYMLKHNCGATETRVKLLAACARLDRAQRK
jgi:hypothetical protein